MNNKHVILITNDDGIDSWGLAALINSLRNLGELVVFAPDGPRSAMSGALTVRENIKYKTESIEEGLAVYSCTGTPVDCVKLALHIGIKPHMLISGINHGGNMSICVHYSGTVGAAIEGCINGIPSIAISLDNYDEYADFSECTRIFLPVARYIYSKGMPKGMYYNMNVPNISPVKGIKLCRQSDARFTRQYVQENNDKNDKSFMLTGRLMPENIRPDDDLEALGAGYASIVPCKIDVTGYEQKNELVYLPFLHK